MELLLFYLFFGQEVIFLDTLDFSYDPNNKQLEAKLVTIKWITKHLLNIAYVSAAVGTINSLLLRFYPSWTASDFDFIDKLGYVTFGLLEYSTFSNHIADFHLENRF